MLKNLPKGVRITLYSLAFIALFFVLLSVAVVFFKFPFSSNDVSNFLSQHNLIKTTDKSSNPEDSSFGGFFEKDSVAPTTSDVYSGLLEERVFIKSELKEYKKAMTYMKDKMNEFNLLNAKLLFTNKLFKSHTLDNKEKMKIIENFDRATTLKEVKLVYVTIAESYSTTSLRKRKNISESASKSMGNIKKIVKESTTLKPVIVDRKPSIIDGGSVERMKKLANIK